ncbi:NADH dehydrogenase [ubiquinone] 1 alpha subcomplex assembly factor 2-like isoform X2 [Hydractinia symbiolongicarpus]|uniref:NADH dehydrogenase [ubiquinone] 1 alpha subcomplex assembly factor 2-like isoform X2 n=1 Tax=Hydractinia symbiolongicarpus TaxID=13093 RepID=UPI00254EFF5A|nr:NADH dehydrogenase [ubiquinone] 1 alpha subcomplex assembly factor 2-like isoform X2 [Hydractinia symbiolongicarpus]
MVIKWLRAILSSSKKLIGTDHLGNKYFEEVRASGKIQRSIQNDTKHEDYSAGHIPLQWEAWIRGKRKDAPTLQEIEEQARYTSTVLRRAAIKTKEDDKKQAIAYADGLIAKERPSDNTPAKQALSRNVDTNLHATTGTSYQPDAWSPAAVNSDTKTKYEPESWTPELMSKESRT